MSLEPTPAEHPHIPRDANGRFLKGAPGRPKGALGKMSGRIVMAFLNDFAANHRDVLQAVRVENPVAYARLVTRLLDKCETPDQEAFEPLEADAGQETLTKGLRAMRADAPKRALIADYRAMESAPTAAAYTETLGESVDTHIAAAEAVHARHDAQYQAALADDWLDDDDDDEDEDEDDDDGDGPDVVYRDDPDLDEPGVPPPWFHTRRPAEAAPDETDPPLEAHPIIGEKRSDPPPGEEELGVQELPPRPSASSFDWSPPPLSWKTA